MNKLIATLIAIAFVAGLWSGIYLARREIRLVRAVNLNTARVQEIIKALNRNQPPVNPQSSPEGGNNVRN